MNHEVGALEIEDFEEYAPIELDIQDLFLQDSTYDVIICCHVLEHVEQDEKAIHELYRVLKPQGFAILQVPLALDLEHTLDDKSIKTPKLRKTTFGQTDHLRLYGKDYFTKIENAGFRVVKDNAFMNKWLHQRELERHRLDQTEDVVVCYKD